MTDWRLDAIVRLNKLTGADETTVARVQESNRLFGIKVYAQDIQKVGERSLLLVHLWSIIAVYYFH